jgi:hypothetical protein
MMIRSGASLNMRVRRLGRISTSQTITSPFENQCALLGSHNSVMIYRSSMSTFSRTALQIQRHSALQKMRLSPPIFRSIQTHTISDAKRKRAIALLAKGIKIVRIPFIILSVFGLGYNQGIMEYAKGPDKMKVRIICGIELSVYLFHMINHMKF